MGAGGDPPHDAGHHKSDAHGHADHGTDHGHGHGHGHGGFEKVPHPPPFHKIPRPQIGTNEHLTEIVAFDNTKPVPPPRDAFTTFRDIFFRGSALQEGNDLNPGISSNARQVEYKSVLEKIVRPWFPLRPATYVDPYLRPNPCPERFWDHSFKWPNTKVVNPKIPPPVDGKYNDYYHYVAFKHWFQKERDVYLASMHEVAKALHWCTIREGRVNAAKNCRHLFSKHFSMRRMEELNQVFLYMSQTGNCAIRETPYPENFVEEKRKIYDDWLFRTRMRKPGDVA